MVPCRRQRDVTINIANATDWCQVGVDAEPNLNLTIVIFPVQLGPRRVPSNVQIYPRVVTDTAIVQFSLTYHYTPPAVMWIAKVKALFNLTCLSLFALIFIGYFS